VSAPVLGRIRVAEPQATLTRVEAGLPTDPFLLTRFESFYQEVVALKAHAGGHSAHGHISRAPEEVRARLLSLLRQQEADVSRTATLLGSEMYRQAQRVMACMADEIFSSLHWPADSAWRSMEAELFEVRNHHGFSPDGPCMMKLGRLLDQDDPAYRELVAVYFYALSLSPLEEQAREQYLQTIREMLGQTVDRKVEQDKHIFEQSYAHTDAENPVTLLPPVNRSWWALVIIVVIWLGVSWLMWIQVSSPVSSHLQQIQQALHP
jgi:type VI protein secretion system component VasF